MFQPSLDLFSPTPPRHASPTPPPRAPLTPSVEMDLVDVESNDSLNKYMDVYEGWRNDYNHYNFSRLISSQKNRQQFEKLLKTNTTMVMTEEDILNVPFIKKQRLETITT